MDIESVTLDVFLSEEAPINGGEYNSVLASWNIPGKDWVWGYRIGDVIESNHIIAEEIVERLEKIDISELFPKIVSPILFHNGSRKGVPFYDGHNDLVLVNKLDSQKYSQIFSFIKERHPKISYQPSVSTQSW